MTLRDHAMSSQPTAQRDTNQPAPPKLSNVRTRLLLEGPIPSTLLRLAAPNLVVNVILIAVTTSVDAYFVGTFGPNALAGISLVFPLIMLMQQVANATVGGVVAVTVRAVIVISGGWLAMRFAGAGFVGISAVAAAGLVAYGAILIAAFLTTNTLRQRANIGA
jgi:hypothetical protein